jgi:hypothetical protein
MRVAVHSVTVFQPSFLLYAELARQMCLVGSVVSRLARFTNNPKVEIATKPATNYLTEDRSKSWTKQGQRK